MPAPLPDRARSAVVTGAASGIGRATAARLGTAGFRVIGIDRPGTGDDVVVVEADLSLVDERRRAVDEAKGLADGTLAAIVTCAGLAGSPDRKGSLLSSVNYFGTVEVLGGLRPLLPPGGAAVAISSNSTTVQPDIPLAVVEACLAGDEARAGAVADEGTSIAAYAASKIAVAHWVRAQATGPEWAGAGLRLNAVAPGMIDTPMVAAMRADERTGPMLDALPIPLGRPGRPEEVAALIEFLVGPDSTFFCGSVVFCDGGSDALLRTRDWPAAWDISLRDFTRHAP
jgi:NAD(P)-dependent dehydrogenase (short-subunit alcohol dehydrogenase family)